MARRHQGVAWGAALSAATLASAMSRALFINTTPLPEACAGEACAQVLFFESDEVCEPSKPDRGGKYQGQRSVRSPKT